MRKIFALFLLLTLIGPGAVAQTQDWVFVEMRRLPSQCSEPIDCIGRSNLLIRNFIAMQPNLRADLALQLNAMAAVRGIPDAAVENLYMSLPRLSERFHSQPDPARYAALVDHPGVYFDPASLDDRTETREFSQYVRTELEAIGVRFLTEDELEQTPGRPTLSVRFTPRRESEGCIHPFYLSMAIREEVVLARDPSIRVATSVWSGSVRQDLTSVNFVPESALRQVVSQFVADWQAAHSEG